MTYSEYKEKATNPPADNRPSVYVLHVFRFGNANEAEYPEFNVDESPHKATNQE